MNSVLQKDIEYFIEDFEEKSQIELVEGKEKSELEKISEARGMKIKGSRDLAMFKTIYAFTNRANKNGAILPQKELLKVLPQIIGKPISVNHNRRFVVGHYVDYKYIQKENKIIAYGVFYKSNFGEEWEQAKKLFKKKKLSSSFEIWSPGKARKILEDGTYELRQMEIAGGALVFQDEDNEPAFEGADVLAIGKTMKQSEPDLVYASRHKEEEIIRSNQWQDSIKEQILKREEEKKLEEEQNKVPEVPKVTCSHCQEEFETTEVTNIKCPKCFSIVNNQGEILYPPQIKDFRLLCPACKANDWLILQSTEEGNELRCKACAKEYAVKFKQEKLDDTISKIKFLYEGYVSCVQCGNRIMISGVSDVKEHEVNCKKCGLNFKVNTDKLDKTRTIESIVEKTSEERRKEEEMKKEDEKKEVEVKEEQKEVKEEVKDTETPKAEEKVEDKAEEPKAEEKKEEAPKAEEKKEEITKSSEDKTEDKVETTEEKNVVIDVDKEAPIVVNEKGEPELKQPAEEKTPEATSEETAQPSKEEESQDSSSEESKEETQGEAPETKDEEIEVIDVDDDFFESFTSDKEINEASKSLSDDKFAVVTVVKSKKTSKKRKLRMLPINDRANVKVALSTLPSATKTLNKLGISTRIIKARILKQAKKLGMKDILKQHKANVNKIKKYERAISRLVSKVSELKTAKKLEISSITAEADKSKQDEIAKINKEANEKIEFYQANAQIIVSRRLELGEEYSQSLSDKDIVNDDKFAKAKLEKENASYRAQAESTSDDVGVKSALDRDDSFYATKRAEIDKKAFGNNS